MSSQESQTRLVEYALLVCLHCLDQVVHVDRKQRHQAPLPILAGKRVHGVFLHSQLHAPLDRFAEHFGTLAMTIDNVDVVFPSPASIPIHDHRYVAKRQFGDSGGRYVNFFSHDTVRNSFQETK